MSELSPQEIISILAKRIANLKNGSGDYSPSNRVLAIRVASESLARAEKELGLGN